MFRKALFATAICVSALAGVWAHAQSAPGADPHAGHRPAAADPHAGHEMSKMNHGGAIPTMDATGTPLRASSPAPGAMLSGSPKEIFLALPHAMTVHSLVLTNAVGQRIPLSTTLSETPVDMLSSPTPTLPPGVYTVAWSAGSSGHTMAGSFGFMVH